MYDYAVNHILLRAAAGGVMRGEVAGFMIFHLLPNLNTHTHVPHLSNFGAYLPNSITLLHFLRKQVPLKAFMLKF